VKFVISVLLFSNGAIYIMGFLTIRKSNPTCASPCLCRRSYQNLRGEGTQPGRSSNGLSRRGRVALLRGMSCQPVRQCESLPFRRSNGSSPLGGLLVRGMRLSSPAKQVCGGVTRRQGIRNSTGEVPRRRSGCVWSVEETIRHRSERPLRCGGEENSPLLASSLGMAADPE
jgi:hypothetical protein